MGVKRSKRLISRFGTKENERNKERTTWRSETNDFRLDGILIVSVIINDGFIISAPNDK